MQIGFTTGCLYRSKIQMSKRPALYNSHGSNAIEISFATPDELSDYTLTQQIKEHSKKFDFVSLHAHWKDVSYAREIRTKEIVAKIRHLCDSLPIKTVVLHPDTIAEFSVLDDLNFPFVLENNDSRKEFGIDMKDFYEIMHYGEFGYVLDLQHAYENDASMKLADNLLAFFGSQLSHLHVSGENNHENHVPVHLAHNRESIASFFKRWHISLPIILEGILLENIEQTITAELEFVKAFRG